MAVNGKLFIFVLTYYYGHMHYFILCIVTCLSMLVTYLSVWVEVENKNSSYQVHPGFFHLIIYHKLILLLLKSTHNNYLCINKYKSEFVWSASTHAPFNQSPWNWRVIMLNQLNTNLIYFLCHWFKLFSLDRHLKTRRRLYSKIS